MDYAEVLLYSGCLALGRSLQQTETAMHREDRDYLGLRCWAHTLEMQIPLFLRAMSSVVFRKEFLWVKFRGLKKFEAKNIFLASVI